MADDSDVPVVVPVSNERRGAFVKWAAIGAVICLTWGTLMSLGVMYHVEYKDLCSTEEDMLGVFGICFLAFLFARSLLSEILLLSATWVQNHKPVMVFPSRMNDVFNAGTQVRLVNAQIMACTGRPDKGGVDLITAEKESTTKTEECSIINTRKALDLLSSQIININKQLTRPQPTSGTSLQKVLIATDVVPMFSLIFFIVLGIQESKSVDLSSCGFRSRTFNLLVFYCSTLQL